VLRKFATLGLMAAMTFSLSACDEVCSSDDATTGEVPACCPADADAPAAAATDAAAPAAAAIALDGGEECDACPGAAAAAAPKGECGLEGKSECDSEAKADCSGSDCETDVDCDDCEIECIEEYEKPATPAQD